MSRPVKKIIRRLVLLAFALLLVAGISCRTLPPLPAADLSAAGWSVRHGQAVWKALQDKPEIAGDLLLATNQNGNFFVQFTKAPFTLASAQISGEQWQIDFGGERSFRGRGEPPSRFVWFQLPHAFGHESLDQNWKFTHAGADLWRFENARTGETLEGAFFP